MIYNQTKSNFSFDVVCLILVIGCFYCGFISEILTRQTFLVSVGMTLREFIEREKKSKSTQTADPLLKTTFDEKLCNFRRFLLNL